MDAEFTRLEQLSASGATVVWVHDDVLALSVAELQAALIRDGGSVARSLHREHGHTAPRVAPWRSVLDNDAGEGAAAEAEARWERAWVRTSSAKRRVKYLAFAKQIDVLTNEMVMNSRYRRANEQVAVRMRIALGGMPYADSVVVHCSCTASGVDHGDGVGRCRVRAAVTVQFTRKKILVPIAKKITAFALRQGQRTLGMWLQEMVKAVEKPASASSMMMGPDVMDVRSVAKHQLALGNISQLEYDELVQSDQRFRTIAQKANEGEEEEEDDDDSSRGTPEGFAPSRSHSTQRLAPLSPTQRRSGGAALLRASAATSRGVMRSVRSDGFYASVNVDSLDSLWAQQNVADLEAEQSALRRPDSGETAIGRCWRFFCCCFFPCFGDCSGPAPLKSTTRRDQKAGGNDLGGIALSPINNRPPKLQTGGGGTKYAQQLSPRATDEETSSASATGLDWDLEDDDSEDDTPTFEFMRQSHELRA